MSRENFEPSMAKVKVHEGGYVNHKADPGGETNFGISKRSYPRLDIKKLTWDDAKRIYRKDFWDRIQGDELPSGVDFVTLDPAINSGVSQAAKFLQRAVGVKADGRIGPQTLAAVQARPPVQVIQSVSSQRLGFFKGLRTWATFGRGWSRRVAEVEASAVVMAGVPPVMLMAEMRDMNRAATSNNNKAFGATAGTSSVGLIDLPIWGYAAIAVVLVLIVGTFMGRRLHEQNRIAAYTKELENAA